MVTNLISFPFRVSAAGNVVTLVDGTDEYYAEELALLCMTSVEERDLVPGYGLTEPTFGNFDQTELRSKVRLFGPPVRIDSVETKYPVDGVQQIRLSFEAVSEQDSDDDFYSNSDDEELSPDDFA